MFKSVFVGSVALCLLAAIWRREPEQPFVWWTANPLVKVRPNDRLPGPAEGAKLDAARNEFEPFQVVLRSAEALGAVDCEMTDLASASHETISKDLAAIYFERYISTTRPSNDEVSAGEWPDPLIPRVDRYVHQKRNAFPFDLKAGRTQGIWIDLYVPPNAAPGEYSGEVRVTAAGQLIAKVPVTLNVWNFTLPSTSSLTTAYGFSGVSVLKQHRGGYTDDDELRSFTRLYGKAALMHRVTLFGGTLIPPPFSLQGNRAVIDWRLYDAEVGPFLDGSVLSKSDPLSGARWTSVDLRTHGSLDTDESKVAYWQEWVRHFKEKGWIHQLFNYVWDEPAPDDYPRVVRRASVLHRSNVEIPNLVTAPRSPLLQPVIDIWTPLINCFERRRGFEDFCGRNVPFSAYADELEAGKKLWWYQSCGSHGCNIVGGAYFRDWPSYVIDTTGVQNRIMPWLTWKYGIQGELYYNTVEAFNRNSSPMADVYMHGGNGDGTLFYPGKPSDIGGKTDIPIESIRLKLIREGLEDYEYLSALSRLAGEKEPGAFVDHLVQNTYTFDRKPETLYAVRRQIASEVERRTSDSTHR